MSTLAGEVLYDRPVQDVEAACMTVDAFAPPKSDAELFEQYYDEVKRLVYKAGVRGQDTADIASDILLRFYERKMLAKYDPTLEFEQTDGSFRSASFRTFLYGFVKLYMWGKSERYKAQLERELIILDKPVPHWEGVTVFDAFGPSEDFDSTAAEVVDLVDGIRLYLAEVPKRSKQDVCNLPKLFERVVEMSLLDGKISIKTLAAEFEVTGTAIHSWLRLLRHHVAVALGGLGYDAKLGYYDKTPAAQRRPITGMGFTRTERGWAVMA